MADANQTPNPAPKDLIGFLDYYLVQKAPFQIPDAGREWIVKFGPWLVVVLLVVMVPTLLTILGLGTMFSGYGGYAYGAAFSYWSIILIIQLGLEGAALPGLFARKMSGWRLLFYSQIVGLVFSLLSYNIIGGLIGVVIGMYILFQIRMLYKE